MLVVAGAPADAAGPSCAAGESCLFVTLEDDARNPAVFSNAQLDAWPQGPGRQEAADYEIRNDRGRTPSVQRINQGPSIRGLIQAVTAAGGAYAGVDPDTVSLVKIPRPGTSHVATLTPAQLVPVGSEGLQPMVHTSGGANAVGYVRPTRDQDDVNGDDFFFSNSQTPLYVTLSTTGTVLEPTVSASPQKVQTGEAVALSVDVPGRSSATLTYPWEFGDGTTSAQAAPSHAWAQSGSYAAAVTVTSTDGSIGEGSTTVSVGDRPQPSPSSSASPNPGGGGTNPNATAPTTGPDKGSKGTKTGGKVDPSGSPTTGSSAVPGAGTTGTDPSGTSGSAGTTGDPGPSLPAPPTGVPGAPTPVELPPEGLPPAVDTSGESVIGLLLSSVSTPFAPTAPAPVDPATAPTAREAPVTSPINPVVWWLLVVPALLLAGAASESRRMARLTWPARFRRVQA